VKSHRPILINARISILVSQKEDEMKFPIEFKKCPICGCTETVTRLACEEEKEKGVIPKEAFVSMEKTQVPLMGNMPPKLTVRVLIACWDVCVDCGHKYCTRVEIQTTQVQIQGPKMPGQLPPGFQFPPGTHPGFG